MSRTGKRTDNETLVEPKDVIKIKHKNIFMKTKIET